MAGPSKKSRKPTKNESSGEESMEDENESEGYDGQQEIQATFEGRNPEGHDFHGIKQLLGQLFLKAHIDLSQMSDMIIAQNGVGSVLKQSLMDSDDEEDVDMVDESDVFGITTVLNLNLHKETPCIQQFYLLLNEMSKKHAGTDVQNLVDSILKEATRVAFLINERFVNIPAKISSVMLDSLSKEIQRIKKKEPSYDFQYYILISKTYKIKGNDEELFTNEEEEIIAKNSEVNFGFSVEKEADTGLGGQWLSEDKQVIPHRRILIFKGDKMQSLVEQITSYVQ